jgi:hypothetical protein
LGCSRGAGLPWLKTDEVNLRLVGLLVNNDVSLEEWALRHRFTRPGTHLPLTGYTYAEEAALNETVP